MQQQNTNDQTPGEAPTHINSKGICNPKGKANGKNGHAKTEGGTNSTIAMDQNIWLEECGLQPSQIQSWSQTQTIITMFCSQKRNNYEPCNPISSFLK
jgi:hypothetical protein